ncbi:flavin reductase family protein [Micromonospora sp. R77]|uniref:flavin reductase family protein n=1 Tax=Micromonospora sp. R77 TaxID=2925836 RepID=UPI001F6225AA|nr:flavin reductase family protein [Micromonospora sp. R77]MCI4061215.1 flavin reductase family protein [Micromonospora sp. R77]
MDVHARPPAEVTDTKLLRRAFGAFATGVTIVTVGGATPHGMTANSFATVSLDPPLVLICVGREAVMHQVLSHTGAFGVSVLAAEQEAVARYFADRRRPLGREQFDSVDWLPGGRTGAPLITGALAHFECALRRTYDGGDHSIFLGELLWMDRSLGDDALLFVDGGFRQVEPKRSDVAI